MARMSMMHPYLLPPFLILTFSSGMVALATLLLEATFPGLVETAYLLVPAGEAGKESLFFMRAEAAFSGVPLLCSPTNALLTLDDDDFAFVATFVDGDELELLSSSLT